VKVLLDTHVLFWCLAENDRLPKSIRNCLGQSTNTFHVSAVIPSRRSFDSSGCGLRDGILFALRVAAPPTPRADTNAHKSELMRVGITGWEIAIKVRIGKWPEAAVLLPGLATHITAARFELLPLTLAQAEMVGSFDLIHRDPFDRLLAAQALDQDMTVATVDRAFQVLGCKVV
jgi:PIN domain nuclease of toxin-antitoxin system